MNRFIELGSGSKEVERIRSILSLLEKVRTLKRDRKERKRKLLAKVSQILKSWRNRSEGPRLQRRGREKRYEESFNIVLKHTYDSYLQYSIHV